MIKKLLYKAPYSHNFRGTGGMVVRFCYT